MSDCGATVEVVRRSQFGVMGGASKVSMGPEREAAAHLDIQAPAHSSLPSETRLLTGRPRAVAVVVADDHLAGLVDGDRDRGAVHRRSQPTARGEDGVADGFGLEAADRHPAQQAVVGIDRLQLRSRREDWR